MNEPKIRTHPENNYRGIYFNGKTIRTALDPSKQITELRYPEFYDVKVTNHCEGGCSYCYMNSIVEPHYEDILYKTRKFFSKFDDNQKPYQLAAGGGETTSHPDFIDWLKLVRSMGIVPNYTTNGMFVDGDYGELIKVTKECCGGVAVSCHPHLKRYWEQAIEVFLENNIFLALHIIISDEGSVNRLMKLYKKYSGRVNYFVLLPYSSQGRGKDKRIAWDYLESIVPNNKDIAFGANFYEYLKGSKYGVSLYEPESMSKFLDLKDMQLYKSSFHLEPLDWEWLCG